MNFLRSFSQKDASPRGMIARGDAARDQRDWARAASAYKAALEAKPDLSGIWVQYGHVLKESGQISDAIDAYGAALEREPDHAETCVHMAHALKRAARYEEAIDAFERAIALDPSDDESAQELFSLQRRLNLTAVPAAPEAAQAEPEPEPDEETEPDAPPPPSQEVLDLQAALQKERETSAANALRLSALQTLHEDIQAENETLKEQIRGQQAEIEKQRRHEIAHHEMTAARDALRDEVEMLKEKLDQQQAELENHHDHREERLRADSAAREELAREVAALKQKIGGQQNEIEALRRMEKDLEALQNERDEAFAKINALRAQLRDHDIRTDLAREEFLRSEGQIALMKDMFLREGEL